MKNAGYITMAIGFLSLIGSATLVGWYHYRDNSLAYSYTWRIEYAKMPANDAALADWLKSQPGVSEVSIARDGKFLVVNYDAEAGQPIPKTMEKAESLGYEGQGSFFGDMRGK